MQVDSTDAEPDPMAEFKDFVCSHEGCLYFSRCKRATNRKQAVERHELLFPVHCFHFREVGNSCRLCVELVRSDVWVDAILQFERRASSQVVSRLLTKGKHNQKAWKRPPGTTARPCPEKKRKIPSRHHETDTVTPVEALEKTAAQSLVTLFQTSHT